MKNIAIMSNIFLKSISALIFISMTILVLPVNLTFPSSGLDESWRFALNEAIAQGLIFGKDILFTGGPYASVYTRLYHPATYHLMLLGSLLFLLGYLAAISRLIIPNKIITLLGFSLLLIIFNITDTLFFTYIVLFVVTIYCELISPKITEKRNSLLNIVPTILLLIPFGILPLAKFSFFLMGCPILLLTMFLFLFYKQRLLALLTFVVPTIVLCLLWIIAHQQITALPTFVINSLDISLGYSDAMSISGNRFEIILYVVCAGFLLTLIVFDKSIKIIPRLYLFICYSFLLFVMFKEGFIRHDGHALIATSSLLVAIVISLLFLKPRILLYCSLALGIINWIYTSSNYGFNNHLNMLGSQIENFYINSLIGLKNTVKVKGDFTEQFNQSINQIKSTSPLPHLEGSTDIYPFDQSDLIASGNKWAPRPIIQSYSAYTDKLLSLNLDFLENSNAPQNIFFRIRPIDGRLPSLDDGKSWPTLINNYYINMIINDQIVLKRRDTFLASNHFKMISDNTYKFNENIYLKENDQALFAQVEIQPTLAGKMVSFLYKLPTIKIVLTLENGAIYEFKLMPNIVKSGFILSPFINDNLDFILLNTENWQNSLKSNKVKSFTIVTNDHLKFLWNQKFNLKLSSVPLYGNADISRFNLFDKFDHALEKKYSIPAIDCQGSIDTINNSQINQTSVSVTKTGLLKVSGWAILSPKSNLYADSMFITLTDAFGKKRYVLTKSISRTDVNSVLKLTSNRNIGFIALIDPSKLNGDYLLGISQLYKNQLYICKQIKVPVKISS